MEYLVSKYATRNVPRYTSYPTAPHFSADVTPEMYEAWLRDLPAGGDLSLYLHVPYCQEMCWYCGCHTKVTKKEAPLVSYGKTLAAEVALIGKLIGEKRPVSHIHWGGGTPSLLPDASFRAVVASLREWFDLDGDLEHAIELDPRTVTTRLADTLAECGVTRASLGVQDFNAEVQAAIGRIQSFEVVENSVNALRGAGINAINLDLMYGLPKQTPEDIRETVDLAMKFKPSRLALFGYAHVPWMKKHQRLIKEEELPGVEGRLALAAAARDRLAEYGFEVIGLDHFAQPDDPMAIASRDGTLKRNFQGYTTDAAPALIGFGASSIGKLPQGYAQNAPDIGGWSRSVEDGHPPIARGKALDDDDRARALIIEEIMTAYTVDVAAVAQEYGIDIAEFDSAFEQLGELIDDNLVAVEGKVVTVLEAGRPYVRIAAAAFDSYLAAAAARH
ncbi:MAG: oxygen-independent coproporphyrinogen III oxidase [Hyphomicrobiales bacterium]|nr:MAG: oxygen-independent coproporphyrinogen III oxidase [Hyphomicrobiales bacterium]